MLVLADCQVACDVTSSVAEPETARVAIAVSCVVCPTATVDPVTARDATVVGAAVDCPHARVNMTDPMATARAPASRSRIGLLAATVNASGVPEAMRAIARPCRKRRVFSFTGLSENRQFPG
jgi:hypothetical protein